MLRTGELDTGTELFTLPPRRQHEKTESHSQQSYILLRPTLTHISFNVSSHHCSNFGSLQLYNLISNIKSFLYLNKTYTDQNCCIHIACNAISK